MLIRVGWSRPTRSSNNGLAGELHATSVLQLPRMKATLRCKSVPEKQRLASGVTSFDWTNGKVAAPTGVDS